MMLKTIIGYKKYITDLYQSISLNTKKEIIRFIWAFAIAWLVKTILNEIPFFTQLFYISKLDTYTQNVLISFTQFFLNIFGYKVYTEGIFIQIINTTGIRYELGCLAFRHLTLFIVFIMVSYGKIINKLWYIPLGIFIIFITNALRGSIICISQVYFPNKSIAIHDIISPLLMYITILALWIIWLSKFGQYKKK